MNNFKAVNIYTNKDGEVIDTIPYKDHEQAVKENIDGETYFIENNGKENLSFGRAMEALKRGCRISRKGWNGKGMFLFLLPEGNVPTKAIHDPALKEVIEKEIGGDTFQALGSIRMFTADKKILTGWLASQTDMLSEDWTIL